MAKFQKWLALVFRLSWKPRETLTKWASWVIMDEALKKTTSCKPLHCRLSISFNPQTWLIYERHLNQKTKRIQWNKEKKSPLKFNRRWGNVCSKMGAIIYCAFLMKILKNGIALSLVAMCFDKITVAVAYSVHMVTYNKKGAFIHNYSIAICWGIKTCQTQVPGESSSAGAWKLSCLFHQKTRWQHTGGIFRLSGGKSAYVRAGLGSILIAWPRKLP